MWLVMHFQLERNSTYAKVRAGEYSNIRMRTTTNAPGLTGKGEVRISAAGAIGHLKRL